MTKRIVLSILTWPASIIPLGLLLVLRLLRQGEFEAHERGMFVLRGEPNSFMAKHWHFSTTLSPHCIYLDPFASDISFQHELKHTSQAAGVSIAWALVVGMSVLHWHWVLHTVFLWPACWFIVYTGASIKAWLSNEHSYLGNEFEQQAYALSNQLRDEPAHAALLSLGDKWLRDADKYANARVSSSENFPDPKIDGIIQTFGVCSFELRDAMKRRAR